MDKTVAVRVGQIWMDNDKRSAGRRLCVESINDGRARVYRVTPSGSRIGAQTTSIRLGRFRPGSTGYTLIQDVVEEGEAA